MVWLVRYPLIDSFLQIQGRGSQYTDKQKLKKVSIWIFWSVTLLTSHPILHTSSYTYQISHLFSFAALLSLFQRCEVIFSENGPNGKFICQKFWHFEKMKRRRIMDQICAGGISVIICIQINIRLRLVGSSFQ